MTRESGCVPIAGKTLKSGEWYRRVKRELMADPRFHDEHPKWPAKRMAHIYGIEVSTYNRYRRALRENL